MARRSETITSGYPIGQRVELPVHADRWMMGDRFGVITHLKTFSATKEEHATVKLDKSGRSFIYRAEDLRWL